MIFRLKLNYGYISVTFLRQSAFLQRLIAIDDHHDTKYAAFQSNDVYGSNTFARLNNSQDSFFITYKDFIGTTAHYKTTFLEMGFCFHEILLLNNLLELYPSHISFDDDDVSSTHINEAFMKLG